MTMDNEQVANKKDRRDLVQRTTLFAVMIIRMANNLPRTAAGYVIAQQVIRSGTSVGANTSEAQQAVSKRDFINKMSIALKECKETKYWLDVIRQSEILTENSLLSLSGEADELCAIYSTIVKKAKSE